MCFGMTNAPYTFHRIGESVKSFFNSRAIRTIIYIDDMLVLASSFSQCLSDAQFVIDTLVRLGFQINTEKCVLTPSQDFFFLGFLWDSRRMVCSLPEEKLAKIKFLCKEATNGQNPRPSVRTLQKLLGTMVSAIPAVPLARARCRGIQEMVLKFYDGTDKSTRKLVRLTSWARTEISWWLDLTIRDCTQSLQSIPVWEAVRLATDAMDTAVGSVLEGKEYYEVLSVNDAKKRIAHKEWIAFERTIIANLPSLKDRVVSWHVDNTNVLHAWLNSGSIRDSWLNKRVVEWKIKLHKQNTRVIPRYIRSAQHIHADFISRGKVLPDWSLSVEVTRRLFILTGTPEIDLMATSASKKVACYFSATLDERAAGVDCFTQNWDSHSLSYVFPPPVMMELILNRIYQCRRENRFIVISPWKVKAQWFPKAVKLSLQPPFRLPLSWETVKDLVESGCLPTTPAGNKIKFVAWMLSGGEGPRLEDCPLGLSGLYSRAGRRQRRQAMEWASGTTPPSAEGWAWTSLPRVL